MRANNVYVLGLTGGICCGKSEAARLLRQLGAYHIDADAISRALTAPGGEALPAIRQIFGDGVFREDGSLNRQALGDLVFGDPAQKRALEGILHPLVQRNMLRMLDEADQGEAKVALLDVPLLFETGMDALCDEVWVMSARREIQIQRIMARDGLNQQQAEARVDSQMDPEEREKRAGRVISSEKPLDKMQAEITGLYQQLLKKL